jgi:hypothetical protein
VVGIDRAVGGVGRALLVVQKTLYVIKQAGLIGFQRQHIIGALLDHFGGNGTLAVERVGGDNAAF